MKLAFARGLAPADGFYPSSRDVLCANQTVGEAAMTEQEAAAQDTLGSQRTTPPRSTAAFGANEPVAGTLVPNPHEPLSTHDAADTGRAMTSVNILFNEGTPATFDDTQMPECFPDLNLDQIIDGIVDGREEHDLQPYYYCPLQSVNAIQYRQAVIRDLDGRPLRAALEQFAKELRSVRQFLAQGKELRHPYQQQRWFVDAASLYVAAVRQLENDLTDASTDSTALQEFKKSLSEYTRSNTFVELSAAIESLERSLARVNYCLHIRGNRITVGRLADEPDYSKEVQETFARFRQGESNNYLVKLYRSVDMNHVESGVLELVANVYPEVFAELQGFSTTWNTFLDPAITQFDRETQFYLSYLSYVDPIRQSGLKFSIPAVIADARTVSVQETFDLALAKKLLKAEEPAVIVNDLELEEPERIIVVSGPNQGGKTTFARTFGQLHYLGSLGLPIPGRDPTIAVFDHIFAHFEREESIETLRGKLQDDLVRIHDILASASPKSIIIMNELFTSTTLQDAIYLGTSIVTKIIELDALCVYVTFVDELSRLGPTTVSMVSTVDSERSDERTYKVVRRAADGQAHAIAIANKYGLTYQALKGRMAR